MELWERETAWEHVALNSWECDF